MARVTVEDCIKKIPNRFELVVLAAERVRGILSGDPIRVKRDNDKNPVVALREIAQGLAIPDALRESLVKSQQTHIVQEDETEEEDVLTALAEDQEWIQDPESIEMQEEMKEDSLYLTDEDDVEGEPTIEEDMAEEEEDL